MLLTSDNFVRSFVCFLPRYVPLRYFFGLNLLLTSLFVPKITATTLSKLYTEIHQNTAVIFSFLLKFWQLLPFLEQLF